ncbi:MAG: glutamate synthase large subunit [Thermodesulfobacteriota bacterium]|nr:glutamate synthase large subunit [Thermodesulfobacteriota bacterium]
MTNNFPEPQGLYDPVNEHDACGVGFTANIDGSKDHNIISSGLKVLKNLMHRGAIGGDMKTGDGAGILFQIPHDFFKNKCQSLGIHLSDPGNYGVGMFFMPQDRKILNQCVTLTEKVIQAEGLKFLGWRDVPIDENAIAGEAKKHCPIIMQCFIHGAGLEKAALDRKLYIIRRVIENQVRDLLAGADSFYIPSLSCSTIIYKGLFTATQLAGFYNDLKDPELISAMAVVHQRYSTNTFPSWGLAQPFRYLAHNGEINTIRGNLNHIRSRESLMESELFGNEIKKLLPIINESGSDSSCLDNIFELLVNAGRTPAHSMMMLIPQAWGDKYPMGNDLRGFFEYHAGMMESWDGPGAVAFSNGIQTGAELDRNGLRPARYTITKNGFIVFASETGVLDLPSEDIMEKGALRPGEMILVDFNKKRLLKNSEIKNLSARKEPYRRWVAENKITVRGFYGDIDSITPDMEKLFFRKKLFGYTREDERVILASIALKGEEPVGSMGTDSPLAVFNEKNQLLYSYFKQLFAQVTNPPIDPVREELVMALPTFFGNPGNILTETPQNSRLIKLPHPILSNENVRIIKELNIDLFRSKRILIQFPASGTGKELEHALDKLCSKCKTSVEQGYSIIILSDQDLQEHMAPIPALLAVSAVNQHLSKHGLRTAAGIIVETGEAREVMHMALLLGFGATAINPYLAFETIAAMAINEELENKIDVAKALENYIKALCKGLLKIMSKMGISTLRSYRSAQIFQAIGLNSKLVDRYFTNTATHVEGIGIDEIAKEAVERYNAAFHKTDDIVPFLPAGGRYSLRKEGERHLWTPFTISRLQQAARENDYNLYKEYAALINNQSKEQSTLRGMFKFKKRDSIPLDKVEPEAEIVKRFVTGAMSFGSISSEAHETIAIAMNRLGAKSNSGEGGEDPKRYQPLPNGESRSSAVKQIASGRFGVTAQYLVNARELQIKMAQGAKPGEGGQLPGHKVNEEIARVRHSTPGVTLISPPPHHDIYSIEDLAQLIFDMRNINPKARVSVKLVSEAGVGTVAAGVAKAWADMVLISGHDGGTGASPLSSIMHTGAPWEIGLSETQQTLMLNNLRSKIRLQTDGQLKTGRDVIIASLLGAEEFGFATTALVVLGCVMMRKCHKNTCPVGIATQDTQMRKNFKGSPDYLVNFFTMIAKEVREYMAMLGFSKMDDMIGRTDLLDKNDAVSFWKAKGLDFSKIFYIPEVNKNAPRRFMEPQPDVLADALDKELIKEAKAALELKNKVVIERKIHNTNRTVGTMLAGEIATRYGHGGLDDDTVTCKFFGAAGQSFGAFAARGMTLILEGEANDYVGKGLSGGKIIVKPYAGATFIPQENIIAGNVLLYGATSGELYLNGKAGERFAIRNSGAIAVVEGIGDHGCEYMTGGKIVVLGDTGVNFAAGMSGGIAYIFDPEQQFDQRCNLDMVDLELVIEPKEIRELQELIKQHQQYTGSLKAANILNNFEASLPFFIKVLPMEYRRILGEMSMEDEATKRKEVQHG